MNIFEAILRANEEYTPAIQQLRDYIESQDNKVVYNKDNKEIVLNLDLAEWDYVLTLNNADYILEFSQYDEDEPINIKLKCLKNEEEQYIDSTKETEPQKILDNAFKLVKTQEVEQVDEDAEEADELIQCVIKIEDIGNDYRYEGLIEDNTDYNDQYDVDIHFQDRLEDEPETVNYILAYHEDGKEQFYDENGEPLDLEMDKLDNFEKDYQAKIKDRNNTVPANKDEL